VRYSWGVTDVELTVIGVYRPVISPETWRQSNKLFP